MKALKPMQQPKKSGSLWSTEEVALLKKALESQYTELEILDLFPRRTAEAISWKANTALNYGRKTDTNGIGTFHFGVKRINRRSKAEIAAQDSTIDVKGNDTSNSVQECDAIISTEVEVEAKTSTVAHSTNMIDVLIELSNATTVALTKLKNVL